MFNLFEPLPDPGKYCWIFKLGALYYFACLIITIFLGGMYGLLIDGIGFNKKHMISHIIIFGILLLCAVIFIFNYFIYSIGYTVCSSM